MVNVTRHIIPFFFHLCHLFPAFYFVPLRTLPRDCHHLAAPFPHRVRDRSRKHASFSDLFPHLKDFLRPCAVTPSLHLTTPLTAAFRARSV
jgi:hypothetical protein